MSRNIALYFAVLAFSVGWLFYNYISLSAPIDCGDGLMHFFISQASWEDPTYFLDHWGKPLFILLSSPFAQIGFGGMAVFNSIVFVLTLIVGWRIFTKFKTPLFIQLAFPILLLLTPDYAKNILGGLTEPLFGLFLIAACWAWLEEKFVLFALFAGATLFLRSEGQLVLLFAVGLLLIARQWKASLFLFVPFVIYAIIGLFLFGDFWWYFTKSPYAMDNSSYGVGSYWHYLIEFKAYLGIHGLAITLIGFLVLAYLFLKKRLDFKLLGFIILTYGTFLGIIAAHSYFFGSGQNGSIGLTRIATQGLPSFLTLNLILIGTIIPNKITKFTYLNILFPVGLIILLFIHPPIKKGTTRLNKAILSIGKFINNQPALKDKKIYAYHPLLAYALHSNLKMKNQKFIQYGGVEFLNDKSALSFGDVIVWDSEFGPNEIDIPLKSYLQDPNLLLCRKEITPGILKTDGVFLFQYVPAEVKRNASLRIEKKTLSYPKMIKANDEFYTLKKIPSQSESYDLEIKMLGAAKVHLICESSDHADYQGFDLSDGENIIVFNVSNNSDYILTLWNPEKIDYSVRFEKVIEKRVHLPKLWSNK